MLAGWCKKATSLNHSAKDSKVNNAEVKEQVARIMGEIDRLAKDTFIPTGLTNPIIRPESQREITRLREKLNKLQS
jgi:hypothetical protein